MPSPSAGPEEAGADPHGTVRLIAVLSVCGFASTFAIRFLDPMIGIMARDLATDPHTIALLASAFALPYALIQPILGPIGDAVGKALVMKVCLGVLAGALALAALAPDIGTLFVVRVLSGAAAGGVIPLSLATIGDRVDMGRRQVAIGRFLTLTITGQLTGSTATGLLADWIGWRGVFWLAALMALGGFLAMLWGVRGSREPRGRFSFGTAASRYRRVIAIPRARALFSFVFVEGVFIFGVFPFLAPLLESRGEGGARETGFIVAAFAIGGIAYTLLVPLLLRFLGIRRMLMSAGALIALAFAVLAVPLDWAVYAGAMFVVGLSFYMLHNSFQTQVTELVPDARASAVSLHAFSYFCGQALGPVVIGFGLGAIGTAATMIACGLACLALGMVAAAVLTGTQPRPR